MQYIHSLKTNIIIPNKKISFMGAKYYIKTVNYFCIKLYDCLFICYVFHKYCVILWYFLFLLKIKCTFKRLGSMYSVACGSNIYAAGSQNCYRTMTAMHHSFFPSLVTLAFTVNLYLFLLCKSRLWDQIICFFSSKYYTNFKSPIKTWWRSWDPVLGA